MPAVRRKLDGIRQKVPHNLLKPIGIPYDGTLDPFQLQSDMDTFCVARRADRFHCGPDHGGKLDRLQTQTQLSAQRTRYIEKIIDYPDLSFSIALDQIKSSREYFNIVRFAAQHVYASENRSQRRAKLVRNNCDELVFQAVRFLRFPVEARIIQCKSSAMSDRREEVNVFRIESSGLCRSRREHSRNRVLDKNWQEDARCGEAGYLGLRTQQNAIDICLIRFCGCFHRQTLCGGHADQCVVFFDKYGARVGES